MFLRLKQTIEVCQINSSNLDWREADKQTLYIFYKKVLHL